MKRLTFAVLLSAFVCLSTAAAGKPGARDDAAPDPAPLHGSEGSVLVSSGTLGGAVARETAGPDTFVLYGGPDHPTEGKFQLIDGATPDWGGGNGLPGGYGGGPDAWTPHDWTKVRVPWYRDTFNAENLNANGPGNHAMWCGLPAGDPDTAGWVFPQGYGNNWDAALIYESEPLADPSVGQTVDLEFFLNYDTETDWDFVHVQYDSAGTWTTVASLTGTNHDGGGVFPAPGVRFSDIQTAPITYSGDDYDVRVSDGSQIRIRVRFTSDGGWSDEDGLFESVAGAAQIDNITLTTSQGTFFEDFEGEGPYLWEPHQPPFFGDFADVYPAFSDIDPCRENRTPVAGFIDYGQEVRNGPGVSGQTSTGGSTYPGIEYGIPGNWVVNHTGGLDVAGNYVGTEIRSPEILLDLPGADDDDPAFAGRFLRYDVWEHFLGEGVTFYSWSVRSAMPGEAWGEWMHDNFYWGGQGVARWASRTHDLSLYVPPGAERLQIALRPVDICPFIFWCVPTGTPAPVFDNVTVAKYRLPGPVFLTRMVDTAQDGFPVQPSIDASTQASRDALDVPFSMARDVNTGSVLNVPGDSITVDVTPFIAGTAVTDVRMVWALQTNPLFEDAIRAAPSRPEDQSVVAGASGTVWSGEVVAGASTTSSGAPVADRWFVDLPDADFLYPGDVLHYYVQATDSDGRASTLPHDTSGFGSFGPQSTYDRAFTVRALPTISDAGGTQPELLVINEFGRRGGENEFLSSLQQLGYAEGIDFDTYTVQGPASAVGNGIGSAGAHGATGEQLGGYTSLLYFAGDLATGLLSSTEPYLEKGDDIGTLEAWHALGGTRNAAYFGDNLASYLLDQTPETAGYLFDTMGVEVLGPDVRDALGGQTAPVVAPADPGFAMSFVAYGGCQSINTFDRIQPGPGASVGHTFTEPGGAPLTDPAAGVASVIHPTATGVELTFPFSIVAIQGISSRAVGLSARTQLFAEILDTFGAVGSSPPVGAPPVRTVGLRAVPNPFNPSTVVRFTGVVGERGSVRIYNLRGGLVRELHTGEFRTDEFRWDGTDDGGAAVASGVYLVRGETGSAVKTAKVALVR